MAEAPTNALSDAGIVAKAAGPGRFVAKQPPAVVHVRPQPKPRSSRQPQFQRPNPSNNAAGVPKPTGPGERQLDGSRTQTFSQPDRKPGLAARPPAPSRSSGGSGLETAMAAEADRLHPPKRRS